MILASWASLLEALVDFKQTLEVRHLLRKCRAFHVAEWPAGLESRIFLRSILLRLGSDERPSSVTLIFRSFGRRILLYSRGMQAII